jgi:hypothetical protein
MAAFTANTNTTVILVDTASRAVVKDVLYMTSASDVSARLVVNCALLQGRTMTLTGTLATPAAPNGLIPGEKLTAQDAAIAYVGQVHSPNTTHKVVTVVLANSQVALSNSDVLTGELSNNAFTVASDGAVLDRPVVSIIGAWWSVNGSPNTSISVEFANADCAFTASGTGWFGKGNIPEAIKTNSLTNASGDITVSTYGLLAKGGYTLVLDLRKEKGFGQRPIY